MTTAEKHGCLGKTPLIRLNVLRQYISDSASGIMEHEPVITDFKLSLALFRLPGPLKLTTGNPR